MADNVRRRESGERVLKGSIPNVVLNDLRLRATNMLISAGLFEDFKIVGIFVTWVDPTVTVEKSWSEMRVLCRRK